MHSLILTCEIIACGFKVYPREVEEVLFRRPQVAEAAVTGVPDAYRGETVAAFVVLKTGVEASEEIRNELIHFCEQELTPYKVPKIVVFRESLPKSLVRLLAPLSSSGRSYGEGYEAKALEASFPRTANLMGLHFSYYCQAARK